MGNQTNRFEYVGFWKRVQAALIDTLLSLCLFPIHLQLTLWGLENRTIVPELGLAIFWTGLYMGCVMRFGGTPGKLIVGIRVVDARGRFLNFTRAFRRELFPYILCDAVFMLQIYQAYATFPESAPAQRLVDARMIARDYGEPFSTVALYLEFFAILDIVVILFNRKKRAIHDFIAGSYVITKESYLSQIGNDMESGQLVEETRYAE